MSRFRIRNVILPAILVSSGVFSILTLPIVLKKAGPLWREPQLLLDEPAPTFFERDNKNAIIRYVGGAIVVSVGAGIATIEILRRLHPSNRLSKDQKDNLNSQIRKLEAESPANSVLLSESVETTIYDLLAEEEFVAHWPEVETTSASPLSSNGSQGVQQNGQNGNSTMLNQGLQSETTLHQDADLYQSNGGISYQNGHHRAETLLYPLPMDDRLPLDDELDSTSGLSAFLSEPESAFDWADIPEESAELGSETQSYETYRIRVPHRQDTLFAILIEGKYYSLVRTHPSEERILEIAAKLQQRGDEVLITTVQQRYAIWVLQPEAYLELVS